KDATQGREESDETKDPDIDLDKEQRGSESSEDDKLSRCFEERGATSQHEHRQRKMLWMIWFTRHAAGEEHHHQASCRSYQNAARDSIKERGRRHRREEPEKERDVASCVVCDSMMEQVEQPRFNVEEDRSVLTKDLGI